MQSIRSIEFQRNYLESPHGSVLVTMGKTKVICTATVQNVVPGFLRDKGRGWLSAEYSMLPGSTSTRKQRERNRSDNRSIEIQRLIGRSLRSIVDMGGLGERTIWIDCDVIQADGGTRTASINGAMVALYDALKYMKNQGMLRSWPLYDFLGAVSVGIVDGKPVLDLDYEKDFRAEVDMNVVMTAKGKFVEIQGTAEKEPFSSQQLTEMLDLGRQGIMEIVEAQHVALGINKE